MLTYVAWGFCIWLIFAYGMLIYKLMGSQVEVRFLLSHESSDSMFCFQLPPLVSDLPCLILHGRRQKEFCRSYGVGIGIKFLTDFKDTFVDAVKVRCESKLRVGLPLCKSPRGGRWRTSCVLPPESRRRSPLLWLCCCESRHCGH